MKTVSSVQSKGNPGYSLLPKRSNWHDNSLCSKQLEYWTKNIKYFLDAGQVSVELWNFRERK